MTVHHVVLWKLKPEVSQEARQKIKDDLALLAKIPQVKDMQIGITKPVGAFSQGWEEGVIIIFDSEEDLNIFRPHEAHVGFLASCNAQLQDKLIFDVVVP